MVLQALDSCLTAELALGARGPWVVAFSGGGDSTALAAGARRGRAAVRSRGPPLSRRPCAGPGLGRAGGGRGGDRGDDSGCRSPPSSTRCRRRRAGARGPKRRRAGCATRRSRRSAGGSEPIGSSPLITATTRSRPSFSASPPAAVSPDSRASSAAAGRSCDRCSTSTAPFWMPSSRRRGSIRSPIPPTATSRRSNRRSRPPAPLAAPRTSAGSLGLGCAPWSPWPLRPERARIVLDHRLEKLLVKEGWGLPRPPRDRSASSFTGAFASFSPSASSSARAGRERPGSTRSKRELLRQLARLRAEGNLESAGERCGDGLFWHASGGFLGSLPRPPPGGPFHIFWRRRERSKFRRFAAVSGSPDSRLQPGCAPASAGARRSHSSRGLTGGAPAATGPGGDSQPPARGSHPLPGCAWNAPAEGTVDRSQGAARGA